MKTKSRNIASLLGVLAVITGFVLTAIAAAPFAVEALRLTGIADAGGFAITNAENIVTSDGRQFSRAIVVDSNGVADAHGGTITGAADVVLTNGASLADTSARSLESKNVGHSAGSNGVDVWVFWGQSNMRKPSAPGEPEAYMLGQTDVRYWAKIFTGPTDFSDTNMVICVSDSWSVELPIMAELRRGHSSLVAVKGVKGGTNLGDWINTGVTGAWNYIFDPLTNVVATLRSEGKTARYNLVTLQGETDADSASAGTNYVNNFHAFYDQLERKTGITFDAVYMGGLNGTAFGVTNRPYYANVRAAQQALCASNENWHFVSADGIEVVSDGTHMSDAGSLEMGQRFIDAIYANPPPFRVFGQLEADSISGYISTADYEPVSRARYSVTFDAVTEYGTFAANVDESVGYTLRMEFIPVTMPSGFNVVAGDDDGSGNGWNLSFYDADLRFQVKNTAGTVRTWTLLEDCVAGTFYDLVLTVNTNGTLQSTINDRAYSSTYTGELSSGGAATTLAKLGAKSTRGNIKFFSFAIDDLVNYGFLEGGGATVQDSLGVANMSLINTPTWAYESAIVSTNYASKMFAPILSAGTFKVINTTNLVFIAGSVTNLIDGDITSP